MEEKKELKSKLTIFKQASYAEHRCLLGLDKKREDEFNKGKSVEVSQEELDSIGSHRWLGVKNGS